MEIQTNLVSKEIIKPSSPTPKSLQKYHLSFLDQGFPPLFMPILYFYSSPPKISNSQKSDYLKKSLSETLSKYYPLAGRLVGNLYVDCNDEGVPFSEFEANWNLSQAISDPNPDILTKFLPYETCETKNVSMAVQVTYLSCGGVVMGLLMSHKIVDAFSKIMFVNTWSAVARNGDLGGLPSPKFDGYAYFPPQDVSELDLNLLLCEEELANKIFKFSAKQISLLQERYSGRGCRGHPARRPSRVEALLAHIWIRYLAATGMQSDLHKTYSFKQTLNLRRHINDLSSSEYHFGNFFGVSVTTAATGEAGVELLQKIREANKSGYKSFMDLLKEAGEKRVNWTMSQELANIDFTSLCGFPIYEADFGWGKPILIRIPGASLKNLIIFTPTKSGGGIEVNIRLSKQEMEKFEADLEMQSLLKSNL